MKKLKRPLTVIGEFEPFGLQVVEPCDNGTEGERKNRGSSRKGRYQLFDAETARARSGGYEYNAIMSGLWDHDQELYIHGNKVIWSGGEQVHKQFSADTAVLQAKWCRVEAMNDPLLCILHSDCLMIYTPAGEIHAVPLQYSITSIWAVPGGLLLQRSADNPLVSCGPSTPVKGSPGLGLRDLARDGHTLGISSRFSPSMHSPLGVCSSRRTSPIASTPTTSECAVFALLHPLEEPEAVQVSENGKISPLVDREEHIIWSNSRVPYLVSFHRGRKQHSIWEIRAGPPTKEHASVPGEELKEIRTWEESGTFALQRVWMDKPGQTQADQVFLASDEDGVPIICLVVRQHERLSAFRLSRSDISEELSPKAHLDVAWTLDAVAASPIIALHPREKEKQHYELLVLTSDGELGLYTGSHQMCSFFLSKSATETARKGSVRKIQKVTPPVTASNAEGTEDVVEILSIQDAVSDRVNVLTTTGKTYRCALNMPFSSAVTKLCLSAFAESLRPALNRYLLKHFLEREFTSSEALLLPTPDSIPDLNWAAFSDLIMEIIRDMPVSGEPPLPAKKKEADTSWDFLLQSGIHKHNLLSRRYVALPIFQQPVIQKPLPHPAPRSVDEKETDEMPVYVSVMMEILEVLHAVYEDCKLDTLRWRQAAQLAPLLSHLAAAAGELEYVDHYSRDFPTFVPPLPELKQSPFQGKWKTPESLFKWLENCIKRRKVIKGSEGLPALLLRENLTCVEWSRKVVGFYELLLGDAETAEGKPTRVHVAISRGTTNRSEHKMVLAMVAEAFSLPDLDRLPCGISLPLRHALNLCREAPPGDWPPQAYVLVGREDLAATCAGSFSKEIYERKKERKTTGVSVQNPVVDVEDAFLAAPYMLHLRPITIPQSVDSDELGDAEVQGTAVEGSTSDGMDHMSSTTASLRFGRDLRLNEVRRLLESSRPVAVRTSNSPDVSDPDTVAQQQAQLWQLAQRTTALPFGRGAHTLATSYPLLAETLHIPKLVLAGRLPSQHDATVNLDSGTGNIPDLTSWPEFHNGVAAGLRLAPGQGKISRTWIVYNKPEEPNYAHAGFLMALGLHKHLDVLAMADVYRYLAQEHEATTVGVLLGMAAARRGTMDPATSKMLYLHIPARHPPSFPELELPTLMQSAALMAVGLLYQGSAHRLTTEILLAEIGRKPGGDSPLDREGYALAAGLALGLVTLGRGNDAWGLSDLRIEDRLRHYMSGGREPLDDRHRRQDGFTSSSLNTGIRNAEDLSQAGGQVMEGSMVNLDVTAPGATLALALMFLKTNNKVVAARLAIPDTHFALEYVRPDFILLRLVAKSLTMWDSIKATEEWVQEQIPEIIKNAVKFINQDANAEAPPADADMEALVQAHVNILAGACLSIALRYAGTAKPEAQQLLRKYALFFLQEKRAAASASRRPHAYVDRGTLETCLNVAVLSLSVVMAGTGHLETFRLLRYLRKRNDSDGSINYGNHMVISMANGFLFLGGGLRTFGTNNGAVAALLIALYPRFPTAPNDHRCHLQAFRHLYVLATEARCVQTIDVDTGLPVFVQLEMTVQDPDSGGEATISRLTPCLLPERSSLRRVQVSGSRYWPQDIKLPISDQPWWEPGEAGDHFNGGMLFVKRRVGACSYADDPIGCRSLLSRAFQKDSEAGRFETRGMTGDGLQMSKVDQLVSTFSGDPSMLAFAQLLSNFSRNSKVANEFEDFCLTALFECVSTDRPALLQTYLTLHTTVEALVARAASQGTSASCIFSDSLSLFSLKVALSYCEALKEDEGSSPGQEPIIQHNFLAALAKKVDDVLSFSAFLGVDTAQASEILVPDLVKYFNLAQWPTEAIANPKGRVGQDVLMYKTLFASYLCWYDIPSTRVVQLAVQQLQKILPSFRTHISSNSESLLPVLACVLPGIPSHGLLRISPCLQYLNSDLSQ
ncbi:hypothetical protein R1sor_013816 [Riccia sorocarpa]|uniref:Anaphase-promoting complex subunit 1 n=1 Tax=Riccia sorocarpa TaxID=122646 RepID=A0ABD3HAK9_9MARC